MKAISVRQPFASLLIAGVKHYETRSWPLRYEGRLAIHASKGYDGVDQEITRQLCRFPEVAKVVEAGLPTGVVLGIVEKGVNYRTHDIEPMLSELERAIGDYSPGRAAWQIVKVIDRFERPVVAVGKLGLWEWGK